MSLLEVHGLSKHFGGLEAVGGLSFALAEGEVLERSRQGKRGRLGTTRAPALLS